MQIVDECVSDGKVAALGVSSMSAWLLFANVVNDCGDKKSGEMTKACVLEEAAAVKDWTGVGLHTPSDPSPEAGSSGNCGLLLTVTTPTNRSDTQAGFGGGFENTHEGSDQWTFGGGFHPPRRRLSPPDIDDLIAAYQAGATISQLSADYCVHRTTVAEHLDRHGVPRHHERTAWDAGILNEAAELYATGSSLAGVAHQFGIDAHTVANRFRRAGVAVRPRRGWTSRVRSGQERR